MRPALLRTSATLALLLSVLLSGDAEVARAASLELVLCDQPGEGFRSNAPPDPESAADGNPGATLGAQRLWTFQRAADTWGSLLASDAALLVEIDMEPMSCASNQAVLGSAGANTLTRDWAPGTGEPPRFPQTWYPIALANSLANRDLDTSSPTHRCASSGTDTDIGATFNTNLDSDPSCTIDWYYGFGTPPPYSVSFHDTVLHELAHGLGLATFANKATGQKLNGYDDVYLHFLEDHSSGRTWSDPLMTDLDRADSATDAGNLHWIGEAVRSRAGTLAQGRVGDHVGLYAPATLKAGSSVSHWDTSLRTASGANELMEPSLTSTAEVLVTDELLEDIGWRRLDGCLEPDALVVSDDTIVGERVFVACHTISAGPNVFVAVDAHAVLRAGDSVSLGSGFSVSTGGELAVQVGK